MRVGVSLTAKRLMTSLNLSIKLVLLTRLRAGTIWARATLFQSIFYFTPIKVKKGNRAYVLSEFGGLGLKLKGHTFNNKMFGYKVFFSRESLTEAYKRLFIKTIIPQIKDGLSATVYTQVTDVEDELNGLLTYDREVEKVDFETLKKINERVKLND